MEGKGAAADRGWSDRYPVLSYYAEYAPEGWRIPVLFVVVAIRHSPVLILPAYTAYVLDAVVPRKDVEALLLCLVGMAALIVQNMAVHPLATLYYSKLRRDVALRLRSKLCTRIQHLTFAFHDNASSGRLHSKVMQDVEKVDWLGTATIESIFLPILTAGVALVVISTREPRFLLLILLFLPIVAIQHSIMKKKVEEKFHRLRLEQEKLNADVNEMIVMLPLSRAHGTEAEDLRKVGQTLKALREVGLQTDWRSNLWGAQIWGWSQLLAIAVTIGGGYLVIVGSLTVGEVVMFLSYVGMTVGSIAGMLSQFPQLQQASEAMRSINEIMQHPQIEENEGKPELPELRGDIEFRAVQLAYPGTARLAIDHLSFTIGAHQRIALVGGSGAGKSTVVKLILGLYLPTGGEVLVDGRSTHGFNLKSLRRQVGIVTQETFLFNGTIHQNLTHGLTDVPDGAVEAAAREANAHEFIGQLENGYETEIGDRGLKLSGGQKQRLAIARALLRNPRLLILDEATSALDSQNERLVQEALERLMQGRTTIMIAHRLSTIRHADRILVLEGGRLVEDGTHDELVRHAGVYAHLVSLQHIA